MEEQERRRDEEEDDGKEERRGRSKVAANRRMRPFSQRLGPSPAEQRSVVVEGMPFSVPTLWAGRPLWRRPITRPGRPPVRALIVTRPAAAAVSPPPHVWGGRPAGTPLSSAAGKASHATGAGVPGLWPRQPEEPRVAPPPRISPCHMRSVTDCFS